MVEQITLGPHTSRKPRVALMGEFSSGKSTLSNLLLGEAPLPMKVTATRLPPVWITYGEPASYVVLRDGSERAIDLAEIDKVCIEDTRFIRLHRLADTLQICDLIDMPGISDPNMPAETWAPLLSEIDCVVWCTHATQAWRQSEAAMWDDIVGSTNGDNCLLITQIDKLKNDFQIKRVVNRLKIETQGKFQGIFPISLLQAIEAGDDFSVWQDSGAAEFIDYLVALLLKSEMGNADTSRHTQNEPEDLPSDVIVEHVAEVVEEAPVSSGFHREAKGPITPKRVRIKTRIKPRTPRPEPQAVGHR